MLCRWKAVERCFRGRLPKKGFLKIGRGSFEVYVNPLAIFRLGEVEVEEDEHMSHFPISGLLPKLNRNEVCKQSS